MVATQNMELLNDINFGTTRIFQLEDESNICFCLHIGGGGGEKSACASSRCLATALAASSARPFAEKTEVRERLPRNLGEDCHDGEGTISMMWFGCHGVC